MKISLTWIKCGTVGLSDIFLLSSSSSQSYRELKQLNKPLSVILKISNTKYSAAILSLTMSGLMRVKRCPNNPISTNKYKYHAIFGQLIFCIVELV